MDGTYTFVVPVWCVLLIVASQIVATGVAFWRTLWLRRQMKAIDADVPLADRITLDEMGIGRDA